MQMKTLIPGQWIDKSSVPQLPFAHICVSYQNVILIGPLYHCDICHNYDLCQVCYKNNKSNRGTCKHLLETKSFVGFITQQTHKIRGDNGDFKKLTKESREEKKEKFNYS